MILLFTIRFSKSYEFVGLIHLLYKSCTCEKEFISIYSHKNYILTNFLQSLCSDQKKREIKNINPSLQEEVIIKYANQYIMANEAVQQS